jgi:hypothetical protein
VTVTIGKLIVRLFKVDCSRIAETVSTVRLLLTEAASAGWKLLIEPTIRLIGRRGALQLGR